jgi:hypothetical protein
MRKTSIVRDLMNQLGLKAIAAEIGYFRIAGIACEFGRLFHPASSVIALGIALFNAVFAGAHPLQIRGEPLIDAGVVAV